MTIPPSTLLTEVVAGLSQPHKSLPCKLFYDEEGSALFDAITELPEYYLTRTEVGIMEAQTVAMGERIGPDALLFELGSGSSVKTRFLLDHLERPVAYVPVDISAEHLQKTVAQLELAYPTVPILPLAADYSHPLVLPTPPRPARRTVAYFPGSTIGNFAPSQATAFLGRLGALCGTGGGLLIGFDRRKPASVIEPAYNDAAGITAAFNLNLLVRLNRELGSDFDVAAFEHVAVLDEALSAIEMRLISRVDQAVHLGGQTFRFAAGEVLVTEHSFKYTDAAFEAIAVAAGWRVDAVWTDPAGLFGVWWLVR